MGDGAAFNYIAMREAIEDSGLEESDVSNERSGIIMGSGGTSTKDMCNAYATSLKRGPRKIGPFMVPRIMSNTNSATLAVPFKIKGVNYSITSACATSAHCIGNAMELIQLGKQDIVFAGGGEELYWTLSRCCSTPCRPCPRSTTITPEQASRAFDVNRDGFVISGGGGVVVVEELEHALARGAKIYGELVGYGATSDGHDMVQPSGDGAVRCMRMATQSLGNTPVDYVNTHGTSTPIGDAVELKAIREVFGADLPRSSTRRNP